MKAYNIYYQNMLINKRPLSKKELNNVLEHNVIYKRNNENKLEPIKTNKLRVYTCTIV